MLISWEGTPTQIRMRVGSITFHACLAAGEGGRGVHDGAVCLLYVKILKYLYVYFIYLLFAATQPLISLKWVFLLFWWVP